MNREELALRLAREGFRPDLYSLDGAFPSRLEGYILRSLSGIWTVDYCERGATRTLALCTTEEEACEYMYATLSEDPTTRRT